MKRSTVVLALVFAVCLSGYVSATGVQTVNLLTPNMASAENGLTGFNASGSTLRRDNTRSLDGNYSLHVQGPGQWNGVWLSSIFVADNRETYTFSVYAYGKAGTKLYILIEEKGDQGWGIEDKHMKTFTLSGDGWERLQVTGKLTAGDSVGLSVQSADPFEVWLDRFQLELGDKATDWKMPVATKNLLTYNQATLELDTRGFIAATGGGTAPEVVLDDFESWEGQCSLRITGDGSAVGQGVWTWPTFVPNDRGVYTLSVYVKGKAGDQFYVALEEKDEKGTGSKRVADSDMFTLSTSDWERISFTYKMAVGESLGFNIRHGLAEPFTVWVDGIQLEEGDNATAWTAPAVPAK